MTTLEKYRGKKTRFTCPSCNRQNEFTRYVEDGRYVADDVGKCNRLSCGYHYTPKQYFVDNPQNDRKSFTPKSHLPKIYHEKRTTFSTIRDEFLLESVEDYRTNNFPKGLLNLFPDKAETVKGILQMYFVGTFDGLTAFWQVDKQGKIRTAKLMRYDAETLKRQIVFEWTDKETGELQQVSTYWVHKALEKKGVVQGFHLETVFFGEHLLSRFPDKKIAIVEAEKTALICAIVFRELMPDYIWLASGSAGMLQPDRLARLGNREIVLFPDANAFELWTRKAEESNKMGLTVFVSNLLETSLTDEEKAKGLDLADFLIKEQRERLSKDKVLSDSNEAEKPNQCETHKVLQQLIAKGCFFNFIGTGETVEYPGYLLTEAENNWLVENYEAVMATLFQGWLMKHVFARSPSLLEDFRAEVLERVAIMEDSGEPTAYLTGVLCVSRSWWWRYWSGEEGVTVP